MRKIVEYKVASKYLITNLVKEVNAMIGEGWQPIGGYFKPYRGAGDSGDSCQAMVKYEEE